jgi:hypothetical protein
VDRLLAPGPEDTRHVERAASVDVIDPEAEGGTSDAGAGDRRGEIAQVEAQKGGVDLVGGNGWAGDDVEGLTAAEVAVGAGAHAGVGDKATGRRAGVASGKPGFQQESRGRGDTRATARAAHREPASRAAQEAQTHYGLLKC